MSYFQFIFYIFVQLSYSYISFYSSCVMDSAASCRSCIPFICIPPTMAAPHCSYARLPSLPFSFDFSFSLVQKCEGGYFDTVSEILPSGFVVTRSAGAAAAVAGIEYSSSGFQNSNRSIFLFFFPNKKCINGDHLDFHIFLSLSLDCHIC